MLVAQALSSAPQGPSMTPEGARELSAPEGHASVRDMPGAPQALTSASSSCSGSSCSTGEAPNSGASATTARAASRRTRRGGAQAHAASEAEAASELDAEGEQDAPFLNVSIVNVPFRAESGGLDGGVLEEFFRERDVEAAREYFYVVDGRPHLCCWIEWRTRPALTSTGGARSRTRRDDAGEPLDAPSRAAFEALREWRLARAKELSVPAYRLFTDRVLTRIAKRRPEDRAALGAIEGVGAAALDRWAEGVLGVLARLRAGSAAGASEPVSVSSSSATATPAVAALAGESHSSG